MHRAQMILVRMGQHDARQILAAFDDEFRIRHDDLDTRRRLVAEGDAEIDHQPLSVMAVQIQVHADLARPAKRQEDQVLRTQPVDIGRFGHYFALRPWINNRPWMPSPRQWAAFKPFY